MSMTALVLGAALAQAPDFSTDVLPILEQRCFECHQRAHVDGSGRMRRPKGGLRLDHPEFLLGGDRPGPIVVPGDAGASVLYQLVALPADDPERMPKDAEPLTPDQIARLRRWIDAGADVGAWQGAGEAEPEPGPAAVAPRIQVVEALARGLAAVDDAGRARAAAAGATLREVIPGQPLLEVHFTGNEGATDDGAVQALAGIREHVTWLRLARCAVGGGALRTIAAMPRLTRLDLSRTAIGDAGMRHLARLAELRSLNLYATQVTDASVEVLASLPKLEAVYLHGTRVSAAGAAALRSQRPDLAVRHGEALP